jgi:hypothetical protein
MLVGFQCSAKAWVTQVRMPHHFLKLNKSVEHRNFKACHFLKTPSFTSFVGSELKMYELKKNLV